MHAIAREKMWWYREAVIGCVGSCVHFSKSTLFGKQDLLFSSEATQGLAGRNHIRK